MRSLILFGSSVVCAGALAACSGGGGGSSLPTAAGQIAPVKAPSLGTATPSAAPTASGAMTPGPIGSTPVGSTPIPVGASPTPIASTPTPAGSTPTPVAVSSPTPIPTRTPAGASPTPIPVPSATAAPTATPTHAPTATPSARPTVTPTPMPTATTGGAHLVATSCVYFASNPMCKPLPARPAVAANSASWAAVLFQSGKDHFAGFDVTQNTNDTNDGAEPVAMMTSSNVLGATTFDCDKESYSKYTCDTKVQMQNRTVNFPSGMHLQGGSDHHESWEDSVHGMEVDTWLSDRLTGTGSDNVGGAGECAWGSDGTGCSGSTATDIATSLGNIVAEDIVTAELDPVHGSLPYAISVSAVCADTSFVYPATSSDGANTNGSSACAGHTASGQRPPEGSRWFIALHDADINATSNAPYVKVILRTMDEDHYGGLITDTNWSGAPGLSPQARWGTYAEWQPILTEAGLPASGNQNVPITTNGIDLSKVVTFCSNGTC